MPMDGHALCFGPEASFAGAGVIFPGQCQERQHGQRNMWHKVWHESAKIKLRTCYMRPFVAHLLHISCYSMCVVAW